jgi:PAS domain S-box-containing protein
MITQNNLLDRALSTAKIGVWTYDKDSAVFELSENAQDIFGIEESRLSGINELLNRFVSEYDQEQYIECLNQIIEENESKSGIYQIKCSSGATKWIRCIGQPEVENGDIHTIFGTVQDITDHIETERKLAETQRKYELMAKNSSDGIIIIDKEVTSFVSPGFLKLMCYDTFEDYIKATSGSLRPVIHPEDKPRIKSEFKQKIGEKAATGTYQFRARTGNGSYIWREDHVNYQYDSRGRLEKTYAVCRDITGRKQTEKKLRQLIDEKNWLVSTIVHDIRNPISAGVSLNSILLEEIENIEYRKLISTANEKLESALNLAAELLEISSMEDEGFSIEKENLQPEIIFQSLLDSFGVKAESAGIEFIIQIDPDLPEMEMNKSKMIRVLNNLISNSLKFTPKGGKVRVSAVSDNQHLKITVEDSGIGIPGDLIPTLFDKFTDAKREGLRGESTTGLGLSIAKQIIEHHNGSISVESREGEGTKFSIQLPIR